MQPALGAKKPPGPHDSRSPSPPPSSPLSACPCLTRYISLPSPVGCHAVSTRYFFLSPNLVWFSMACGMHAFYPYAIDQATEWSVAWVGHRLALNFTVGFAYYSFFSVRQQSRCARGVLGRCPGRCPGGSKQLSRPVAAPEAPLPAQCGPRGPRGQPSTRGGRSEAAAAPWCLPTVAFTPLGAQDGLCTHTRATYTRRSGCTSMAWRAGSTCLGATPLRATWHTTSTIGASASQPDEGGLLKRRHCSAAWPPRTAPPGAGLRYSLRRRARAAQTATWGCGAAVGAWGSRILPSSVPPSSVLPSSERALYCTLLHYGHKTLPHSYTCHSTLLNPAPLSVRDTQASSSGPRGRP